MIAWQKTLGRVTAAIAIAACTAWLPPAPAAAEHIFRLGVSADALTLDPIASSDNPSIWAELLIYDTLARPTRDGTGLEPGLAEKWTVSPDGKAYTFTLRDAVFSNGDKVTVDDVIFSLKRAAGEKSDWARFFKPITNYEAVDAKTVKMTLDKPFTPMLNNLALFSASIVPAKLVQQGGDAFFTKPVGSGPFAFKSWSKGDRIVLVKNASYWQKGKPAIDGAEIQVIPEDNSRVLKLQAGELDAILDVPFNQIEQLKANKDLGVGVANVFRVELVQLNTTKKPFDDVRVRQALNYAIDKEAIVRNVLRGNGTIAASAIPVMAHHNTDLKPYPYDPAKAKALLAEAGFANGFTSNMLVPSGEVTYRQVAAIIQDELKKVGVTVNLQAIESGSQFGTTKAGNYEMSISYATSDTIDPDQLIGFTSVNPERANAFHTQWHDDRVNQLYALERETLEGPKRGDMFKEIEARVHDAAPFIFLYHQEATYADRKGVENFVVLPTSNYRLEDVVMK
jgi:peptide/nickel transport system substrate-binding protein